MTHWLDEPRHQHELVTVRTLWVTIALSLLVHCVALFVVLQRTHLLAPDEGAKEAANDRLQVRLTVPERAPVQVPEPPREIVALPKARARPPRAAARTPPPPPVIASTAEAPRMPAPPTPPSPAPPPPAPPRAAQPIESDLWSYIQARRRERGAPQESAIDNQEAQRNANLAANLPRAATGAATNTDPKRGGGIFEIRRMGYDDAAFMFNGWNEDMGRITPQLIEVRKGNNANMRIAVVRRMIAIIREHEQGDFVWRSPHRDRDIVLSARPADNAALEEFLMRDFDDQWLRSP
jgi:hypothetical protein